MYISIQKEIFALPKQGESAMQQHKKCTGDSTSVSIAKLMLTKIHRKNDCYMGLLIVNFH